MERATRGLMKDYIEIRYYEHSNDGMRNALMNTPIVRFQNLETHPRLWTILVIGTLPDWTQFAKSSEDFVLKSSRSLASLQSIP
jgi:hypothetical protein